MLASFRHPSALYFKSRALPLRSAQEKQPLSYGSAAWYASWQADLERVSELFARLIGAEPHEILMASNKSAALRALSDTFPLESTDCGSVIPPIVMEDIDVPELGYHWLDRHPGSCQVSTHGHQSLAAVVRQQRVGLVVTAHVRPADGGKQDLRALDLPEATLLLVDASYSAGWHPLHVKRDRIDLLIADTQRWLLGNQGLTLVRIPASLQERFSPLYWGLYGLFEPTWDTAFPIDTARLEALAPAPEVVESVKLGLECLHRQGIDVINQHVLSLANMLRKKLREVGLPAYVGESDEAESALVVVPHVHANHLARDLEAKSILVDGHSDHLSMAISLTTTESDIKSLIAALSVLAGVASR